MGRLIVRVTAKRDRQRIEDVYAGVVLDLGHELALAVCALKSADSEVHLPGFYEDVNAPTGKEVEDIEQHAAGIVAWTTAANDAGSIPDAHIALGAFIAPSLVVRELRLENPGPFLPQEASTVVDIRLLAGQSPYGVLLALTHQLRERLAGAVIEPLLVRQPGAGRLTQMLERIDSLPTLPIAPGDSPAGILDASGIPNVGFATVSRRGLSDAECVELTAIATSAETVRSLVHTAERVGMPRES
jgi:hypothetical protein